MAGGHYRSFALREDGWWPLDDEHVFPSPGFPPSGLDRGAYVLFFEKVEFELGPYLAGLPPQWQDGEEGSRSAVMCCVCRRRG